MTRSQPGPGPHPDLDGRPRIVVADDDDEMRDLITSAIETLGYQVTALQDGKQMFDYVIALMVGTIRIAPALFVSDIRMPGLSGFEILSALRNAGLRIPVILMTGFGDPETHARAEELGAALTLDKPFPMARLQAAVRSFAQPSP